MGVNKLEMLTCDCNKQIVTDLSHVWCSCGKGFVKEDGFYRDIIHNTITIKLAKKEFYGRYPMKIRFG